MSNFKQIMSIIVDRVGLSIDDAFSTAKAILTGTFDDVQVAALLTGLRVKGETPEEIAGFVKAMKENCIKINTDVEVIDTAGTGGDGYRTINVSTISAIITASGGAYVLKHGNRAVSSSSGSADFLEALGFKIELEPHQVIEMLRRVKFSFIFAPKYHPLMRSIMPIRKKLGFRTIFNLVGPLSNPGNVKRQVIGVADKELMSIFAEALKLLKINHALIVHGEPGIDEASTFGKTYIIEVKREDIDSYVIEPKDLNIPIGNLRNVTTNSPSESIEKVLKVLRGEGNADVKNFILINTALAMYVANLVKDFKDGIEYADKLISDGVVLNYLESIIETSHEV